MSNAFKLRMRNGVSRKGKRTSRDLSLVLPDQLPGRLRLRCVGGINAYLLVELLLRIIRTKWSWASRWMLSIYTTQLQCCFFDLCFRFSWFFVYKNPGLFLLKSGLLGRRPLDFLPSNVSELRRTIKHQQMPIWSINRYDESHCKLSIQRRLKSSVHSLTGRNKRHGLWKGTNRICQFLWMHHICIIQRMACTRPCPNVKCRGPDESDCSRQ